MSTLPFGDGNNQQINTKTLSPKKKSTAYKTARNWRETRLELAANTPPGQGAVKAL